MKNKIKNLAVFGIILISVISFILAVNALTPQEEIAQLENELNSLNSAGYDWLINYSLNYPSIEVYEFNKTELIATFENVSEDKKYQIFLNNLNGSQDVFDLKVLGGSVLFDYIVDPIVLSQVSGTGTNTTLEGNNVTHLNISNSSIVLYMPFDENFNSTYTFDYTNNSNDGTLESGTVINTTSCVYGNCYTFDGVNDRINVPDSNVLDVQTGNMAASIWLKTSSSASSGFNDNVWHNLVGVKNSSTMLVYVDGVQQGSGTTPSGIVATTENVNFGTRRGTISNPGGCSTNWYSGSLDEAMIWNTALNDTEVLAIYNNQTQRFFPSGTMNFTGVNFAGNDTINITLDSCQQNMGSSLKASVNDGAFVAFDSSCFIKDYNATGNLNSANVTIQFIGGNGSVANTFYTPLVLGNISLGSRDTIFPQISFKSPTQANGTITSNNNSIIINTSITELNLNTAKFNWNGTNFTIFNDSTVLHLGLNNFSMQITEHPQAEQFSIIL
ncbi:LamG domain-containing protein [Candidatus Pacearchaeota archaeon]|nr:LamG domain-containing protein [Candidatus Pacearchaeota archaeon]